MPSDTFPRIHEPHGYCRVCHIGVHRYRTDDGLTDWQHVNIPSTSAGPHDPAPKVYCCEAHGA